MKLNFITNLPLDDTSGGGSAVNSATYNQLRRFYDVNYCGPINLPYDQIAKFNSKLCRILGFPGNYHFFSAKRLHNISAKVEETIDRKADFNFFHGSTSWINFNNDLPYYVYTDACFATYVAIYNKGIKFSKRDLDRIYHKEAEWLAKAKKVFFRSKWALNETIKHYNLDDHNFSVAGLGGFIDIPNNVRTPSEIKFLFISREFYPKGGALCVEAFEKLLEEFPQANLVIVGDKPPKNILLKKNIQYKGFLNKSDPAENSKLRQIFEHSFALIHPTTKDTNALVISEAGYYGCPAIAPRSFAIPELISDNETGFLLDTPITVEEIYSKMRYLCLDIDKYYQMRQRVREFSTTNFIWDKVGNHFYDNIRV